MAINDINAHIPQTTDTRNRNSGTAKAKDASLSSSSESSQDTVELSAAGKALRELESKISQLPDVDSERVNQIRERINSGQYNIDSQRLAENILNFESKL